MSSSSERGAQRPAHLVRAVAEYGVPTAVMSIAICVPYLLLRYA